MALCQFWLATDYTASTASILNLFILSLDRYWSVTQPLRYLRLRTRKRARAMIAAVWLVSSLWVIPIGTWHLVANNGERTVPDDVCDTEYAENTPLKIVTGLGNFYLPIFVMYGLYGRIFYEIQKRSLAEMSAGIHRGASRRQDSHSTASSPTIGHSDTPVEMQRTSQREPSPEVRRVPSPKANNSFEYYHDEMILDPRSERVFSILLRKRCDGASPWRRCGKKTAKKAPEAAAKPPKPTKNSNSIDRRSTRTSAEGQETSSPKETSSAPISNLESSSSIVTINHSGSVKRTSKRQSNSLRREKKAARQLGVIMGVFTLCFLPYFTLFLFVAICRGCIPDSVMLLVTWIGYVNSTLNPFLYPLCNTVFRAKFKHMLTCRAPCDISSGRFAHGRDRYFRSTVSRLR